MQPRLRLVLLARGHLVRGEGQGVGVGVGMAIVVVVVDVDQGSIVGAR